jgi:hypothetical protein
MPTLRLTDEQVLGLIKDMSVEQQQTLYQYLLLQRWPAWADGIAYAEASARKTAAARGKDWDAMTEDEREDFVDELVHEGQPVRMPCTGEGRPSRRHQSLPG